MVEEIKNPLQAAQEKLANDMRVFEQTEGWNELSQTQKRLLQQSMYFQTRADRANEPALVPIQTHDYEGSAQRIDNWYCSAAVWSIENERPFYIESPVVDDIPVDFFNAEYFQPRTLVEIEKKMLAVGFPAVVHIAQQPPPLLALQTHSFLALGKGEGDIVGWEKQDEKLPFRRNTLTDVYLNHSDRPYYWGVRKLKAIEP